MRRDGCGSGHEKESQQHGKPADDDARDNEEADERNWRRHKWVIEPTRMGFFARLEEVWRYRRILVFFAGQRVKDRYEGMTLGPFWLFARPLMPIFISTVVFGRLLNVPSEGIPYFLFYLAGSSCWRIFERSMRFVTLSLESAKGLIKKVYFPRIIAPIAAMAPALTEFLILFSRESASPEFPGSYGGFVNILSLSMGFRSPRGGRDPAPAPPATVGKR